LSRDKLPRDVTLTPDGRRFLVEASEVTRPRATYGAIVEQALAEYVERRRTVNGSPPRPPGAARLHP
jgi:hypothetical protein